MAKKGVPAGGDALELAKSAWFGAQARRVGATTVMALTLAGGGCGSSSQRAEDPTERALEKVEHVVIIYMENNSFDKLYGHWGTVNGMRVDGLLDHVPPGATQINQRGEPFECLMMNDVNLSDLPLTPGCRDTTTGTPFSSNFPNAPFVIDDYVWDLEATCPFPGRASPNGTLRGSGNLGGCTRDLTHKFYQEQYQINGGKMNRYVQGSEAVGLVMGREDTRTLPVKRYLDQPFAPTYVLLDRVFAGAFGGSFLNHQFLVANEPPVWPNATNDGGELDFHSVVDRNGMPVNYPLYQAEGPVKEGSLSASCDPPPGVPAPPEGVVCGDFAVNWIQPTYQPHVPGIAKSRRLPPQTHRTVGEQLSEQGVDWAWYAGGWDNAAGNVYGPGWTNGPGPDCEDPLTRDAAVYPYCSSDYFMFHHQPFNYFEAFAPGTTAREDHLLDEVEFLRAARLGNLKPVSFVKFIGNHNQHPGYASAWVGSQYLADVIMQVMQGPQADSTLVIVTYDEFGGAWDHVPPPKRDAFGPGTRIPALLISNTLPNSGVDSTRYTSFSAVRAIEEIFGLEPLNERAKAFPPMTNAYQLAP